MKQRKQFVKIPVTRQFIAMIKRTLFFFLTASLCLSVFSFIGNKKEIKKKQTVLKTIVVDAGHGIMPNGGHNIFMGR